MKESVKSNKIILAIAGVAGVIVISILVFALVKRNQPAAPFNSQSGGTVPVQSNSNTSAPTGSKKTNQGFNLFSWLFPSHNTSSQSGQTTTSQSTTSVTQSVTQAPGQNGAATAQEGQSTNGSSGTGSQATNATASNNSYNSSAANNPNATQFQIVFTDPGGQTQAYVPPDVPPIQVTWNTYVDNTYHYSIEYPAGWQTVNGQTPFAQGTVLFLPGENTTDPSQKYISFGWSNYNIYPTNSVNYGGSVLSPAKVTGVNGTIYTRGPLGQSYIVSVFPYRQGYFGLITYTSDPTITYVYQHMLESLVFNR